jgi:hypothetical protein
VKEYDHVFLSGFSYSRSIFRQEKSTEVPRARSLSEANIQTYSSPSIYARTGPIFAYHLVINSLANYGTFHSRELVHHAQAHVLFQFHRIQGRSEKLKL